MNSNSHGWLVVTTLDSSAQEPNYFKDPREFTDLRLYGVEIWINTGKPMTPMSKHLRSLSVSSSMMEL